MAPLIAATALLATVAGCGSSAHDASSAQGPDATVSSAGAPTTDPTTDPATDPGDGTVPDTVDVGSLPQTHDRPGSADPAFDARVQALWQGIVDDDPTKAMAFLFPMSAYHQVKILRDPDKDWHTRIEAAFTRDIHAMHAALGANAGEAALIGMDVPDGAAQWINPHEEYNKLGYWRVYGSTLSYSAGGKTVHVPIYSLISWRGEWYIVHADKSDPMNQ